MDSMNASFASPLADAAFAKMNMPSHGILQRILDSLNGWSIALTILLCLVTYDQGTEGRRKYQDMR